MIIVCAGVVLASLDLFIVNVALPEIARDFARGNGLGDLSWVLNGYAIVYAALLVLFGRLAERRRRDNGFLLGVVVFMLASAACGAASSLTMLVAFRIVQAAGAALLTPTSLSLVLATTAPERRHERGPRVDRGRRAGRRARPGRRRSAGRRELALGVPGQRADRPGRAGDRLAAAAAHRRSARAGAGRARGAAGHRRCRRRCRSAWSRAAHGGGEASTVGVLALRLLALALFAAALRAAPNPLIDRALFRLRPFTGASAVALLFSAAFGAMLLSRVLWAQDVWGWSALHTGLAFAPGPLMVPLFSFLVAGRLIARFGAGVVIAAGSTIYAAGAAWWALARV